MIKKLLGLFLFLPYFVGAQSSDGQNTTDHFNIIRNQAAAGGNTRTVVADAFESLNSSKVNRSETVVASGTDTYTITPTYTPDYSKNPAFKVKFVNGNTGAVTVNTIPVKKNVSSDLGSGDIVAGGIYDIVYDGTNFQIQIPSSGGGSGTVTSVTSADGNATVATQTTTPVITIVSAPKLQTARNIQGVAFDGTGNINIINGTGFVKSSGTTLSYDNSTYLTSNQTISFAPTGDVTGSTTGTTTLAPALVIGAGKVTNAMLAGSIAASKLVGTDINTVGTIGTGTWQGTAIADSYISSASAWNAKVSSQWTTTGSDIYYNTGNVMVGAASAPSSKLHIVETSTSTPRGVLVDQYNTGTNGARITLRKARGTFASPTTIVTGDALASWTASGYDGAGFIESGKILSTSTGTISAGVVPSKMELQTTNSSGTLTTGLTVDQSQSLTIPAYTTNGGLLYTDGSGVISQTSAPGTALKWLRSNGTNWITSTSTLAEGGVTSGKLMVSDGTNWIASTPTFPNASATSGKIIKSDGTNWTASTETYAAPGSSGNVLTSDGTNWTSAAPASAVGAWLLASGGTLTGANTVTSNAANQFTFGGTWTASANNQYHFNIGGSLTARGTTSDALIGTLLNTTLIAGGTTQHLIGLDINPTYTAGATTPNRTGIRVQTGDVIIGTTNQAATNAKLVVQAESFNTDLARFANSSSQASFNIGTTGVITLGTNNAQIASQTNNTASVTGLGLRFGTAVSSSNRSGYTFSAGTVTDATGANVILRAAVSHSPTSGSGSMTLFNLDGTYNQTGTSSGNIYDIKIDPTVTAILGNHYAIASSSGSWGVNTLTPTSTMQVSGSFAAAYIAKTANYTLTATDYLVNCTANSFTITLPTAVGITGRQYIIKDTGTATTITISTTSSQTIDGAAPGTVTGLTPLRVMSDGANWITW